MCGIVGYVGEQNATPIILNGLKRLEYRGYDSAGVAVINEHGIELRRDSGKLERLNTRVLNQPISGQIGIGHTRWATHGEPNERNAHPHLSASRKAVLVQNGIVENFLELKQELQTAGVVFKSDTDTEVIVALLDAYLQQGLNLNDATCQTLKRLRGSNAIVVISTTEPEKLIAARIGNAGGITIGIGADEMFVASDLPAILDYTRRVVFLDPGQIATITRAGVSIQTLGGQPVALDVQNIAWDPVAAEKGEYKHFMQKEIHEQVRTLNDTIGSRINFETGQVHLAELKLTAEFAKRIKRIVITGCGTAAHAGMVGKTLIEHFARIPVEVNIASELRYSNPIMDADTVLLAISQSGETADTLAAMHEARHQGATLWSIVNAIGSQAMRFADGCIPMHTGPEIGVASTKAFTAPLVDLYLLALLLADLRGLLSAEQRLQCANELAGLPAKVSELLNREGAVRRVAQSLLDVRSCFYLGRGINMPIAYEGALKLKEISYIHAEGYPAGEMKHGPIALVDKQMPVIVLAPQDHWYEKMVSQAEQAKARGGPLVAVLTDGDQHISKIADHILWIPAISWQLSPVLVVIPLQILAYHIAILRGCDVDQPRNLAKSVTVE